MVAPAVLRNPTATRLQWLAMALLAVGLVGLQLSVRVVNPSWELPEWALLLLVGILFLWGFSRQSEGAQEASS